MFLNFNDVGQFRQRKLPPEDVVAFQALQVYLSTGEYNWERVFFAGLLFRQKESSLLPGIGSLGYGPRPLITGATISIPRDCARAWWK
jgi:hypothetical protein